VTGNPYPDFLWGVTNNVTFHNLDLSFTFQGSQGGQLVNGDPNYNETKRYNKNYNTNRWLSPMFPGDGKTPYSTVGFNWMLTDYVVEDASYYTLREVVVGYAFKQLAKKAHLGNLRAYFSAQNLFFHSAKGYRGINTEGRFSSGPYNTALVPMPKTFLFGIDINF
ncbi:MAG: SusC/RagA family TonB-linked outer membrane protein, partial [Ferruginibacter sp.]